MLRVKSVLALVYLTYKSLYCFAFPWRLSLGIPFAHYYLTRYGFKQELVYCLTPSLYPLHWFYWKLFESRLNWYWTLPYKKLKEKQLHWHIQDQRQLNTGVLCFDRTWELLMNTVPELKKKDVLRVHVKECYIFTPRNTSFHKTSRQRRFSMPMEKTLYF